MKVFIPFNGISNGGDTSSILASPAEDDVEYKEKRMQFTYPDDVEKITKYIISHGRINVSFFTIEKLWYAYSEKYDAQFLTPAEYYLTEFIDWISKLEVEDALHMDYYGNIK